MTKGSYFVMTEKKKLILIYPVSEERSVYSKRVSGKTTNPSNTYPPLSLAYIAALTPDSWDVEIIDEKISIASYKDCDLVGITAYTSNINRAYEVAQVFRGNNTPVIMGGVHVSMLPDEALQYVDSVVIGEAESIWSEVIEDSEAGNLKSKYYGKQEDLRGLVFPRQDLFHKGYKTGTIQTSRGCPNDCEFCSVSEFNGKKYRQRPVEEVIEELKSMKKKYILFVDDNVAGYGSSGEKRAIALAKGIVKAKLNIQWSGSASMNVSDNEEVLYWFRKSGCRILYLGIESEDIDILQSWNKKVNIKRNYKDVFSKIHKYGIGITGGFIFGSDDDNLEKIQSRINFMKNNHIDSLACGNLTPLPGTRLFNRIKDEGRFLYTDFPSDWDRYDYTEVIFRHKNMDLTDYHEMMINIWQDVNSRKQIFRRFIRSWMDTKSLITALWCLAVSNNIREFWNDVIEESYKVAK